MVSMIAILRAGDGVSTQPLRRRTSVRAHAARLAACHTHGEASSGTAPGQQGATASTRRETVGGGPGGASREQRREDRRREVVGEPARDDDDQDLQRHTHPRAQIPAAPRARTATSPEPPCTCRLGGRNAAHQAPEAAPHASARAVVHRVCVCVKVVVAPRAVFKVIEEEGNHEENHKRDLQGAWGSSVEGGRVVLKPRSCGLSRCPAAPPVDAGQDLSG
jgi:hypothetical protein